MKHESAFPISQMPASAPFLSCAESTHYINLSHFFNIHFSNKTASIVNFITNYMILDTKQDGFLALFAQYKINAPLTSWSFLSLNV
jgi:hypothetical protein